MGVLRDDGLPSCMARDNPTLLSSPASCHCLVFGGPSHPLNGGDQIITCNNAIKVHTLDCHDRISRSQFPSRSRIEKNRKGFERGGSSDGHANVNHRGDGALYGDGQEKAIRKKMIENGH